MGWMFLFLSLFGGLFVLGFCVALCAICMFVSIDFSENRERRNGAFQCCRGLEILLSPHVVRSAILLQYCRETRARSVVSGIGTARDNMVSLSEC